MGVKGQRTCDCTGYYGRANRRTGILQYTGCCGATWDAAGVGAGHQWNHMRYNCRGKYTQSSDHTFAIMLAVQSTAIPADALQWFSESAPGIFEPDKTTRF